MKSILLLSSILLTSLASFGQDIADVSLSKSNELVVRDSKNNRISAKYIAVGDELSGFSSNIIVVTTKFHEVIVYDQKFQRIAAKYIGDNDFVKNVTGNNIIVKTKTNEVITYDKKFTRLSSRYE